MTTLLLEPVALDGAEARVTGEAYRHLFRAARLRRGDDLRVVDGQGRARLAQVQAVDRRSAVLALGEEAPALEPDLELELLVAVPRPQRADWLVEKATELGCTAVRFLAAERSARHLGPAQIDRLSRIARSALEQCGRARLPQVSGTHPWAEIPELLTRPSDLFLLDPESPALQQVPAGTGPAAVLVGPEGGWTDRERRHLAALGCRALSLGPRTLRVETAALAAAALLLLSAGKASGVEGVR